MAPTAVAQPPRPPKPSRTRYFKGKAPELANSDSDDDSDDDGEIKRPEPVRRDENVVAGGAGRLITNKDVRKGLGSGGAVKMSLGDVKIGGPSGVKREQGEAEESEEEESEEEEEDEAEGDVKPTAIRPPGDESSEYETDSEEESEEEKKPVFRPVFVKKDKRGMTAAKLAEEAEEAARKEEELQAQRKLDSKELAGETIRRELAEKEAGTDLQPDVDDTDGLDPALEFDQWRARELSRLLRDKQAQAARDAEQEEIERRRALPEEQRLAEDMAFAEETRAKEKGQMGFLQKYYHRGAFHAGPEAEALLNRDYTVATESSVDMSMLPKVMQVKNFGKASRTKYTHLTDQDTSGGGWGNVARPPPGGPGGSGQTNEGCWNCGGPHQRKDCPNNDMANDPMSIVPGYQGPSAGGGGAGGYRGGGGGGGSGSNLSALGSGSGFGSSFGQGGAGGSKYGQEGKERRFDEERKRDEGYGSRRSRDEGGRSRDEFPRRERDRDREGGGGYPGKDDRRDRDRDNVRDDRRDRDRERKRSRSKSPRREKDDRRRRDDRDRERDRDRDRDRDRR